MSDYIPSSRPERPERTSRVPRSSRGDITRGSGAQKDERLKDIIRALAATFLERESNRLSLITVTNVVIGNRGKDAVIYFTVLPEDKEKAALDFAKRKRSEFREYARTESRIPRIPFFDFEIDKGEKNRQHIDELAAEAESGMISK